MEIIASVIAIYFHIYSSLYVERIWLWYLVDVSVCSCNE